MGGSSSLSPGHWIQVLHQTREWAPSAWGCVSVEACGEPWGSAVSDFRTWGRSDAAPVQLAWFSSELCGAEEGRGESDHGNSFWGWWSSTRAQILEGRITEPDSGHPQLSRRVAGTRWGLSHGVRDCVNPRGRWHRPCLRRSCSSASDAPRNGLQFVLTGSSRRRFPET